VPVASIAEDLLALRVRVAPGLPVSGMLVPAERLVLVDGAEPSDRRRFTLAHEVAHWVLHCASPASAPPVLCRQVHAGGGRDVREREANVFAADLLMPEDAVRGAAAAGNTDPLALAPVFAVSEAAMRWRLYNLGLMPAARDGP